MLKKLKFNVNIKQFDIQIYNTPKIVLCKMEDICIFFFFMYCGIEHFLIFNMHNILNFVKSKQYN